MSYWVALRAIWCVMHTVVICHWVRQEKQSWCIAMTTRGVDLSVSTLMEPPVFGLMDPPKQPFYPPSERVIIDPLLRHLQASFCTRVFPLVWSPVARAIPCHLVGAMAQPIQCRGPE